jgi:ATP-dependent DNA helicase RecQ
MTNDKFSLVHINPSISDFKEGKQMFLKFSKQENETKKSESSRKSNRRSDILTGKGMNLFEALRVLRTEIAREEAVPPYIIFSDKTLLDMCKKVPFDENEMLDVQGVGTNKFEKYGERFLEVIFKFCNGTKQTFCYEDTSENNSEEIETPKSKQKKTEFQLTEDMKEKYEILSNPTLSEIVAQLNELRDSTKMKVLNVSTISKQLVEEEYIFNRKIEDEYVRKVLPKGLEVGIYEEERTSPNIGTYVVLIYNEKAQLFLLDRL